MHSEVLQQSLILAFSELLESTLIPWLMFIEQFDSELLLKCLLSIAIPKLIVSTAIACPTRADSTVNTNISFDMDLNIS